MRWETRSSAPDASPSCSAAHIPTAARSCRPRPSSWGRMAASPATSPCRPGTRWPPPPEPPCRGAHPRAYGEEVGRRPGMAWNDARARDALKRLFAAAVASADPRTVLARHLPEPPGPDDGRVLVLGAGKSAAAMAAAVEATWPDQALSGLVVTRYDHAVPTRRIEVVEASHPVPDAAGEAAARRILEYVDGLTADYLVVCLISGGGSALLSLPA